MAISTHRVVVLISVNGLRTDYELFEEACARHGWAILEQPAHPPQAAPQDVLRTIEYLVEVRMPGAYGAAMRGARLQVEKVAHQHRLDLHVRIAARFQPDSRRRPLWRSYAPLGASPPGPVPAWLWEWLGRGAAGSGLRDTGREVRAASREEALRLARKPLPGTTSAPPGVRVRTPTANPEHPLGLRWAGTVAMGRLGYVLLGTSVCGALLTAALRNAVPGPAVVGGLGLAAMSGAFVMVLRQHLAAVASERRGAEMHTARAAWATVLGMSVLLAAAGTSWDGAVAVSVIAALSLVLRGLYLFIQQRTWRDWVPWVLPALLPFAFGAFPGVGSFVHRAYLGEFGLEVGDVAVPGHWQVAAAFKWGLLVLALLVGPTVYGHIRHNHLAVEDRVMFGVVIGFGVLGMSFWVVNAVILGVAEEAGADAREAAARGDTPSAYYGIAPEWVCARPLGGKRPDELAVRGGEFTPTRPYLMLGDSRGTVVLWDPGPDGPSRKDDRALHLRLADLRLTPTEGDRRCPDR
ncbi:hypothetical protein SMD44_05611 [Streptomyces alboflavus]|uniref:Uncharacterized protein n=1 Tax=Streptomyces alboflavus TaxID=67267 RepID=A0A1Z1WII4_9ACTN|nr:hypothetical protein [Streptomyces alboflavus]ARX86142.1 hypothetical protein SMD44_05611 [Streptomyces alboflavus]